MNRLFEKPHKQHIYLAKKKMSLKKHFSGKDIHV